MAELLTVVAILAILMGLVGVGVYNYLRDLTLTEYDNAAKSVYIAAQNSIADLQASGEWVANEKTYTEGDAKRADDGLHYYVAASAARGNGILPAGSIEAQVWDGDFIIEYSYETAAVFGVFYTEGGQPQLEAYYDEGRGARDRDTRRTNNPIIGYYGGAGAKALESVTLEEPVVSAGRSPVLGVTDPNLEGRGLSASNLVTLVTIEEILPENADAAAQKWQIKLMLRRGLAGKADAWIVGGGGVVEAAGFAEMSGEMLGKETTYSIDLAQLKANAAAAPYLADAAPEDEYRVTARVTTSEKLCRPAYGYGDGIWPGENEEAIFTSNIIADYENEADLYVYRDEVNQQGGDVTFDLENWYNDLTKANEDLYYRIVANERISINSINRFENDTIGLPIDPVNDDYYEYPYDERGKRNVAHRVSFKIRDISSVPEGTVFDIKVTAYRKGTFEVPGKVGKTLTVHVRVMNQRPFGYQVKDHGSYVEVVVTAGVNDSGPVKVRPRVDGLVSDQGSTAFEVRGIDGQSVQLHSIPAGSSVSFKYFKTDASVTHDEGSFNVYGPQE